jgi:hypothetical protein
MGIRMRTASGTGFNIECRLRLLIAISLSAALWATIIGIAVLFL